jgi:hypothetical protein
LTTIGFLEVDRDFQVVVEPTIQLANLPKRPCGRKVAIPGLVQSLKQSQTLLLSVD